MHPGFEQEGNSALKCTTGNRKVSKKSNVFKDRSPPLCFLQAPVCVAPDLAPIRGAQNNVHVQKSKVMEMVSSRFYLRDATMM
jgi:hypothetical protein